MPTPSKFTAERRARLLEGAQLGLSRQSNAIQAQIDEATLRRWLEKGRTAQEGSAYKRFHDEFLAAEVGPRSRALAVVQGAWIDKPDLAWKFIERREPGYAPPMPNVPERQGPITIELALSGGSPMKIRALEAAEIIEGELVADEETGVDPAAEDPSSAPAASR